MTMFEELKLQIEQDDFPEWLKDDILAVAEHPERYADRQQLVSTLLDQVRDYDPYAGASCFSESFGVEDIQKTLKKLTG